MTHTHTPTTNKPCMLVCTVHCPPQPRNYARQVHLPHCAWRSHQRGRRLDLLLHGRGLFAHHPPRVAVDPRAQPAGGRRVARCAAATHYQTRPFPMLTHVPLDSQTTAYEFAKKFPGYTSTNLSESTCHTTQPASCVNNYQRSPSVCCRVFVEGVHEVAQRRFVLVAADQYAPPPTTAR